MINWFSWINLDVFSATYVDCINGHVSYYTSFLTTIIAPIVVVVALPLLSFPVLSLIIKARKRPLQLRIVWNIIINHIMLFLFIVYTGVSLKVLQMFKCREVDGEWYLEADLTIKCYDSTYRSYLILASFAVLVTFILAKFNACY
jgi:hypothetical protein